MFPSRRYRAARLFLRRDAPYLHRRSDVFKFLFQSQAFSVLASSQSRKQHLSKEERKIKKLFSKNDLIFCSCSRLKRKEKLFSKCLVIANSMRFLIMDVNIKLVRTYTFYSNRIVQIGVFKFYTVQGHFINHYIINFPFSKQTISSTCCFINLLFHQLVVSSTCHFTNLRFHQPNLTIALNTTKQ